MVTWVVIASHNLDDSSYPRNPTPESSYPRNLCVLSVPALNLSFSHGRLKVQPSIVPTFFDLSLFLSHSSELFCVHQNLNSFIFKRFRTLLQKHRGGGTPISIDEDQNETANS